MFLGDERITALPQHERVKRGMTRTFQINTLFPGLTVLESVGARRLRAQGRAPASGTARWRAQRDEADEAQALLATLRLDARGRTRSRATCPTASSGWSRSRWRSRRSRASCCSTSRRPAFRPARAPSCSRVIAALPRDVTILFIEHDMELVFRFAERITVLVGGRVLTEGTPAEIAADPRVREVYLGEAQHG